MEQVIILGTASAVPTREHENTHIFIYGGDRAILVDTPGNPVIRLKEAGVDHAALTDVIITHFHPDHVSGLGPLLMDLWLLGRKKALTIYGLESTIDRAQKMMGLYGWHYWPGFYPVNFIIVPSHEMAPLIDVPGLRILASPVKHLVPTMGLRMEFGSPDRAIAYSCDTEPSQVVVRLAKGAQALIHEATGEGVGHTSPEQAGTIASQAGAKSLYLVHYPPMNVDVEKLAAEAARTFSGRVVVAQDFQKIDLE
jgi:ribonuclease Z